MVGPRLPIRRAFGPEDLRPALEESGVDATVVVQTWSSLEETWEFLETAADTDFVAAVVGWVDRPLELPAALQVAREQPGLRFVVDHIAKPEIASGEIEGWWAALAPFGALPKVHCKLSGMPTEAHWQRWSADDLRPYVERVLELFGTDRVLFGSDRPVCLLAGSYRQVLDALQTCIDELSEAEKERIPGLNAIDTYGLSVEVAR